MLFSAKRSLLFDETGCVLHKKLRTRLYEMRDDSISYFCCSLLARRIIFLPFSWFINLLEGKVLLHRMFDVRRVRKKFNLSFPKLVFETLSNKICCNRGRDYGDFWGTKKLDFWTWQLKKFFWDSGIHKTIYYKLQGFINNHSWNVTLNHNFVHCFPN